MNTALVTRALNMPVAVDSLETYIREVNSLPLLTETEERQAAEQWHNTKNQEAAYRLVMSHLRFVVSIARDYMGYGLALGDLIQEGNVGLMKAVKRFDPNQGARLSTFAIYWIKAEIHEFILRNWRIVKIATTKAQRKLFFKLRSATSNHLGWLKPDEVKAIAQSFAVDEKTVTQMEARLNAHDLAFDGHPEHEDEEDYTAPAYYLTDHHDLSASLEQGDWDKQSLRHLYHALDTLDARSQAIIQRRWFDDNKATLHELAAEYGVSAERIRQIEASALKKLKMQINQAFEA